MSLPYYRNSFVGRRGALQQLTERLEGSRLLVLSGTVGIGKTRLAVQWIWGRCRQLQSQNVKAAWLSDTAAQQASLMRQLKVPIGWSNATAKWLAHTGVHTLLIDGGKPELEPILRSWLEEAPELVIVVTSREMWPDNEPLSALSPEAAARLFLDRAPRKLAAADVEEVLRRLDGLPLAIELMAARLEVLSLKMLRERLETPLELLRNPDRDGVHASLRSAIAISWATLRPHEQLAMAQCSVFEGSIPLDVAEAIVRLPPDAPSVLDTLHRLVRRSLLRRMPDDDAHEARFTMMSVIAAFSREHLQDAAAVEERHGQWYDRQIQRWTEDGFHRGLAAVQRMDRDYDNIQAVVKRSIACGAEGRALRAAIAVARAGHSDSEMHRLILRAQEASVDERLVGRARLSWANVLRGQRRFDASMAEHELILATARQHSDLRLEGYAHGGLGNLWALRDEPERAEACFREALRIGEQLPDLRLQALALNALSSAVDLRRDNNLMAALSKRQRALQLVCELEDVYYETWLRARVAYVLLDLGRPEAALREAKAGLDLSVRSGQNTCSTYEMMARIHLVAGQLEQAQTAARLSLKAWQDVYADPRVGCVPSQQVLALVALEQERHDEAAEWLRLTIDALGSRKRYADLRDISQDLLDGISILTRHTAAQPPPPRAQPFAFAMALLRVGSMQAEDAVDALRDGSWMGIVLHRIASAQLKTHLSTWRVARDGMWFKPPGQQPVSLKRRQKLRAVLAVLMSAHVKQPDQMVSRDVMLDAVWPGEAQNKSLHNRLYVAISTLRRLGMSPVLRVRGGYGIDPQASIRISDAAFEDIV